MGGKHNVADVINGSTFVVFPQWTWRDQKGEVVRPTGYHAPEYGSEARIAKEKLSNLIMNKEIEIGVIHRVEGVMLFCDVYFQGKNLAEYFPEY
ncbi:MAG TPA: thermonuclease family protein [Dehalococcoidia bacterium]|nr:thermonuclease family protein [Dehalococcoidia bacterium]